MSNNELWQEEVRDLNGRALLQLVTEIRDGQKDMIIRLNEIEKDQEKTNASVKKICKAFPEGDVEGHRRYHETMVEMIEEKRRLRQAILEKTLAGLVWSIIVAGFMLGINYFKLWIKTGGGNP